MFYAAYERFDWERDRVHGGSDPVPRSDPGLRHAEFVREGRFVDTIPALTDASAAGCRTRVHLRLPVEFDPGAPDACQRCAAKVVSRMGGWTSES